MRKKLSFLFVLVVLAAVTSSCIFDPSTKKDKEKPTESFKSLTTKENVLFNLQLAYNRRNITEYDKLLDAGFVFFLSDGDVNGGLPVSWDRTTEITANSRLFDRAGVAGFPHATSVTLDLEFESGVQWSAVIPESAPDEVWQTTTVFYNFQIEVEPDTKYVPYAGAKAQFTVRNVGTESQPKWQLVEWRDLGGAS